MAGNPDDSAEKEHDPSSRRLDAARKQGDVARSTDLLAAGAIAGLCLAGAVGGPLILSAAAAAKGFLDQAPTISTASGGVMAPAVGRLLIAMAGPAMMLLLLPALACLIILLAQRGLVFAPSKLQPRLSRISPLSAARQKFGAEGLFEFTKNSAKLVLVGSALGLFLIHHRDEVIASARLEPGPGLLFLLKLLGQFLMISAVLSGIIGAADLLWQHHALRRRNRMSRQEMLDEMKDSDGNPQAKATRKQRGQEIAMNQMLAEVATASVVIVNPTHVAVALRWRHGDPSAPVVVAKGIDEIALRIRAEARSAAVPIHSDPPTARAIHATTRIGAPISRDHYRAVAAAIRFAEKMRRKGMRGSP